MAKRLKLRKITLRDVDPDALKHIAGGDTEWTCNNCTWTCPSTEYTQCGTCGSCQSCGYSACYTSCGTCGSYCAGCPC